MASTLDIKGLKVAYGRTEAVSGIDIAVPSGRVVCLIGANGAGKTSTMRAISGLLRPKSGSIMLDGVDIAGLRPHVIAGMGLIQVPEGRQIFAELTVAENLAMGAWLVSGRAEIGRRQDGVLQRFPRLRERLAQSAGSMSGGEQQMLAMGRALMSRPKVLLLDEPSMGLSPIMVDKIFEVVRDVYAQGVTVLLVEQNASRALAIANRGYVMESGIVTMSGDAKQMLKDPKVRAAYLGE